MKLNDWCSQARGRQAALAANLQLRPPTVADWLSGKKPIPLDHCPAIQAFTAGAVTCEELRPDKADYFAAIRALSPNEDQNPPPALANSAQGAMESVADAAGQGA